VIVQLRKGLGDDPSDARYIETVVKRGYRFIAPVFVTTPGKGGPPIEAPKPAGEPRTSGSKLRAGGRALAIVALMAGVGALAVWVVSRTPGPAETASAHLRRLTVEPDTHDGLDISSSGHAIPL
jgi:hypothetical protein